MITLDELFNLEVGTTVYVAAPGRGPERMWTNALLQEKFTGVRETRSGHYIEFESGGYSFDYTRNGVSLFLDKEEAKLYMKERHGRLYSQELIATARAIEELQNKLQQMYTEGLGEPDYKYHKRATNE